MSVTQYLKFLSTLALALVTIALTAKAAPLPQEILPPRLDWENVNIPPPETQGHFQVDDLATSDILERTAYVSWSSLVYQSFNDGNWEVYISPDSTYDFERLTYHNASDIHPRLNRGATRIAFTSNRDGDYELYLMNPDGTGLTKLTNNTTNDVNPTWSPDGTQIAFQSYRDGQPEIYVMNANGSSQRRLTVDSDYDGSPSWSPEGTRIAFVSRRTGGYRIYIMNPDGSNVTQLSNQPYSLNPAWSPEGTRIAFGADGDGNGWQELWIMNADGSNQSRLHNPGDKKDAWTRSWSPDGTYIAFTQVSFVEYRGVWYWTEASMEGWNILSGGYTGLNPNRRLDWHPGWATTDGDAPQSQVSTLPSLSQVAEFTVGWEGDDTDGCGVESLDIQYRVGETGEWTDWQIATTEYSAPFDAVPGTVVYFRSRARDYRYNEEGWPNKADTSTTFYIWQFSGRVIDNRGTSLTDVPISIVPPPLQDIVTGVDGRYSAHLVTDDLHTLTVNHSNYVSAFVTITNSEMLRTFYLPPLDNVIQNGTFEANSAQPASWQQGGTLPVSITTDVYVTGARALVLGEFCTPPCLTDPQLIAIDDEASDAIVTSEGHVHIVWHSWGDGSNPEIYYVQRLADGQWTTPTVVASTGIYHYGVTPLIAVDSSDTLHITWADYGGLKYCQRTQGANWTTPQIIAPDINDMNKYPVDIGVDSNDNVHILVYDRSKAYHFERKVDGQWINRFQIDKYSKANSPQLAIGPDDSLHAFWQETHSPDPSGDHLLFYRTRSPNGTWGVPITLFDDLYHFAEDPKELLCDANGMLHLFWKRSRVIYHAMRTPISGWSTPTTLDNASWNLVVHSDSQGILHLVNTYDIDDGTSLYYRQFTLDTGWSSPLDMSNSENRSVNKLVLGNDDTMHLISSIFPDYVYHQTTAAAGINGIASITQRITISNTMHTPTLSFMGKENYAHAGGGAGLEVFVTDGMTTSTVFSDTMTGQWALQWLDMQAWIGKTITLTLQVRQTADSPFLQVYLDDISLGSAFPDVWVAASSSQERVSPGDEITFTVRYGNRSSVIASDNVITAELPTDSKLIGSSPISPSTITMPSMVWDIGDLAANSNSHTIVITATIELTATPLTTATTYFEISTISPEIEQMNNNAEVRLFIGYFTYLPIALRTE